MIRKKSVGARLATPMVVGDSCGNGIRFRIIGTTANPVVAPDLLGIVGNIAKHAGPAGAGVEWLGSAWNAKK